MNKKIVYTILLLLVTSFVMTAKAEAKSNWDQYFSVEEAKSIKNMVKKSILSEFENPDGDWKKLIGSKMLKDGSIDVNKIKDGAIDVNKVSEDVVKRKIYTGTYPSSVEVADKAIHDDADLDEYDYFIKIAAPEIDASNVPLLNLYEKNEYSSQIGSSAWATGEVSYIDDGYIYLVYAYADDGITESEKFGNQYKVVVGY